MAAASAALLVGLAGCGGAVDTEAGAAAAPSEAAEEPGLALEGSLVEQRPVFAKVWSTEETQDFPEFEERIATIDEAMGIVSDSMEQLLTPGGFSMSPYEDIQAMFADPSIMDEDLADDRSHIGKVIPALDEGDTLPTGYGGEASRLGEELPDSKVVGAPRIRYVNTALLSVDEDVYVEDLLHGAMNAVIELDLEDESTATYAYYISFGSATDNDTDELWGWRASTQFLGVS